MMSVFNFIDARFFVLSLIVGLFAVYISMPDLRTVYVYPTPENVSLLQYKDKTGTCFSFSQEEVTCPTDPNDISKVPVQQ
jgi:hypothetical protein